MNHEDLIWTAKLCGVGAVALVLLGTAVSLAYPIAGLVMAGVAAFVTSAGAILYVSAREAEKRRMKVDGHCAPNRTQ